MSLKKKNCRCRTGKWTRFCLKQEEKEREPFDVALSLLIIPNIKNSEKDKKFPNKNISVELMKLIFGAWVVLIAAVYIMTVSGSIYLFPSFSTQLRSQFQYTTQQTLTIASLQNAGQWIRVLPGIVYSRFGPRLAPFFGALLSFLGYFLMYLSTSGYIKANFILMGIFAFIMGQGAEISYQSALWTSKKNFPKEDQGKIIGLLACAFTLSSAIYTQFRHVYFSESISGFFLFMSIITLTITIIFGFFQNIIPIKQSDTRRLPLTFSLLGLLACYLVSTSLVQWMLPIPHPYYYVLGMGILLSLFVLIPIQSTVLLSAKVTLLHPDLSYNSELNPPGDYYSDISGGSMSEFEFPRRDKTLGQAMKTGTYWVLCITSMVLVGCGIAAYNNLVPILISKITVDSPDGVTCNDSLDDDKVSVLITVYSVCNAIGLLVLGGISDYFLDRYPRSLFLFFSSVVMSAAHFFVGMVSEGWVFLVVVALGVSAGGVCTLLPAAAAESFGTRHLVAIDGSLGLAAAVGGALFSQVLAVNLSDYFGQDSYICFKDAFSQCTKYCCGRDCYFYTLMATSGVSALCTLMLVGLMVKQMRRRRDTLK